MKELPPDERKGTDKLDHLKRSIVNQPNKLKSKRVKELIKEFEETKRWAELEGKTDTLHLGS